MRIYTDGTQVRIDDDNGNFVKSFSKGSIQVETPFSYQIKLYNLIDNTIEYNGIWSGLHDENGNPEGNFLLTIVRINSIVGASSQSGGYLRNTGDTIIDSGTLGFTPQSFGVVPPEPTEGFIIYSDDGGHFSLLFDDGALVRFFQTPGAQVNYQLPGESGTLALLDKSWQNGGNDFGDDGYIGTKNNFAMIFRANDTDQMFIQDGQGVRIKDVLKVGNVGDNEQKGKIHARHEDNTFGTAIYAESINDNGFAFDGISDSTNGAFRITSSVDNHNVAALAKVLTLRRLVDNNAPGDHCGWGINYDITINDVTNTVGNINFWNHNNSYEGPLFSFKTTTPSSPTDPVEIASLSYECLAIGTAQEPDQPRLKIRAIEGRNGLEVYPNSGDVTLIVGEDAGVPVFGVFGSQSPRINVGAYVAGPVYDTDAQNMIAQMWQAFIDFGFFLQ